MTYAIYNKNCSLQNTLCFAFLRKLLQNRENFSILRLQVYFKSIHQRTFNEYKSPHYYVQAMRVYVGSQKDGDPAMSVLQVGLF